MNVNRKNIIKNISYSFSANIISLIFGIIATLLFPKFLNVAGYGYYQLYLFYVGYIIITAFGVSDGVQLRIAGKDYSDLDFQEMNSVFWFTSFTQIILYCILLIISIFLINDINKKIVYIMVCIVGVITHSRYYLKVVLQGTNRLKKYSHIEITERSISIIISIIFMLFGCRNFAIIISIDVIGRIISFILAISYCPEIVLKFPKINKRILRKTLFYTLSGFMILFATNTSSIVIGINRYGIEHHWGIEAFSKISLAIALSNMVLRCVNSISVVMFPTLRNIESKKLPSIYNNTNVVLMTVIFISMCLFKPLCYVIGLWLPNYADSLRYAVLLLPICIYECKYSLLVNTNLKNLNKEKLIGIINALSVMISILTTFIGIYVLKNIEVSIIGILVSLSIRSVIGECVIGKIFGIKIIKNILFEFILSILFILSNYYFDNPFAPTLYIIGVVAYLFSERTDLKKVVSKFKISKNA